MTVTNAKYSYDEVPYQSHPFAQSRPEKLATLGTLFGLRPPEISTARILELGCAAGGNLIPHAVHYPDGNYVGIDLSRVQIGAGQKHIDALALNNIELRHMSILDIDETLGKFDYIICHGVLSWVTEDVRDKIFEVSSEHLTENGIAYISYNTLPGWNMVRTIRDMMLYHAGSFQDPETRVTQARAVLGFIKESVAGADTPYARMLAAEAESLSKQQNYYLAHEYLEDDNTQFYFHEFMAEAGKYNLQYLSDCSLSTMFLGNVVSTAAEKLSTINDIVRTEQYLDFINNRRFRSTLLCHRDVQINRALNNEDARKFAMSLDIVPASPIDQVNLESNDPLDFYLKGNEEQKLTAGSPWLKAILYTFSQNKGFPLSFETIVEIANGFFPDDRRPQIEADLLSNAMKLVLKEIIQISLIERRKDRIDLDIPKLTRLVQYQVQGADEEWVTNLDHAPVGVSLLDKLVLGKMDGSSTRAQILEQLVREAKAGAFNVNVDNVKVENPEDMETTLATYLDNLIARIVSLSVLE